MEVSIEKYKILSVVSNMQTAEMNLQNWLKNLLQKNNLFTVADLMNYSSEDLNRMRGIGSSMLRVLIAELDKLEIKLLSDKNIDND